jgi:hypothetical protein
MLEQFLEGKYSVVDCPTEQDYYTLWREQGLGVLAPSESAIAGALLADRLPWVFAAGYQATLQNAFPGLPESGWAAFIATEDTQDPQAHPGTTLTGDGDGLLLNGHKSWVAHSRFVDHLIVTVNDPDGDKYRARGLIIERARRGVTLTHREQPSFLAGLSQGYAKFENTPVDPSEVFEFGPIGQFGRTEAKFVMLAGTAFMLARTDEDSDLRDRIITISAALIALLGEEETSRQVYATIDREFQRATDLFERQVDTGAIADYEVDKRLFRMYTARIQRRREYAKREASERPA